MSPPRTLSRPTLLEGAAINYKSTSAMAVAAGAYLLDQVAVPMLAGTSVDVAKVLNPEFISLILEIITAVALLVGGMVSRDGDKSSQDNLIRLPAPKIDQVAIDKKVSAAVDAALDGRTPT